MNDQRTLLAWAYLSRVVEPPCAALAAYVAAVGPVEAAVVLTRTLLQGKRTRWQQSPFLLTANKPVQDEDKDESE